MNDEQLKAELDRKLQMGEISQEEYDAGLNEITNGQNLITEFDNLNLSGNGTPYSADDYTISQADKLRQQEQDFLLNGQGGLFPNVDFQNNGLVFTPAPARTPPTITSEVNQPDRVDGLTYQIGSVLEGGVLPSSVEAQNRNSSTTGNSTSDKPSNYFQADYNSDGIPDYLQDTKDSNGNVKTTPAPTGTKDLFGQIMPFLNPYGTDINMELSEAGRFLGMKAGTQGRGLGITSSLLSAGLGGTRAFMSGIANQKQTEKTAEEFRKQLQQQNYTRQTQYLNQNSRGGTTTY